MNLITRHTRTPSVVLVYFLVLTQQFILQVSICGYWSPSNPPTDQRDAFGWFRQERIYLQAQLRMEIPLPWSSSTTYHWISTLRTLRHFWVRLLSRGRSEQSPNLSRSFDAERRRHLLFLQILDQGTAVDLATDEVLYHVPPVEFQTGVYSLHSSCSQVGVLVTERLVE